ncbi:MAG: hypothetical protein RBU30_13425, partial [Polyangia bacterium]|nr:hypothetical protein [Polyangia bacterium]
MTAPSSSMGRLAPRLCLLQCLLTLAAGPRASASPHQPAPPPPQPAPSSPARWAAQRASWESLLRDMEPLARQGAPMPSVKLGRHFRRQGRWPHPSFDPRKASDRERALLAPKGPAALPSTRGPAGRAVWVECGASGAPTPAARELCRLAEATCGLSCTFAPALPAGSSTPPRALLRSLRRLRLDHALALSLDGPGGQLGLFVPSPHATDLAAHSARTPSPAVPTADTLRPLILAAAAPLGQRSLRLLPQPLFRLTLGLQLPAPGAKPAPTPPQAIAEALCRLGSGLPDEVMRAWRGTDAARQARALAISRWMGLSFEERPVEKGRPPLEQRYVRIHYRDRVFNFRQRPSDKAVLIQPLMVVIHDTGGTSLSSALHTLRAKQIGRGQGPGHTPGSLSVGVPYLV